MAKKTTSSTKTTSLFDIRLKNLDHDVLVLKGNQQDAASALLVGKIVLSLLEPITVKKISLRLYCTMQLEYDLVRQGSNVPKPMKFTRKVYEYFWDGNELRSKVLANDTSSNHSNTSPALSRNTSTTSLKNFGSSFRSKSSSQLSSFNLTSSLSSTNLADHNHNSGSSSNNSGSLLAGNHEIPFSAILPGNIPESVEGLPGGSVVYKLEATIERGKFHSPLVTKKHIRVVRTLTTDAVELSETVAVDNTWPKKIEYSLNVPSKAIAIGSQTPISFMMVPLMKGLRLGDIRITLFEYYSYMGYFPPPFNGERIINEKFIKRPSEDDENFQLDRWEVDTFLTIPDSLSKVSQDCDVLEHLRVRHKLKFVIGLVNPDGHVSELRASLPIQLFISPFIAIRARQEGGVGTDSDASSLTDASIAGGEDLGEELLFPAERSSSHASLNNLAETTTSPHGDGAEAASLLVANGGFIAPPVYENHVYDRLWSDISPIESPAGSGNATPRSNRSYHNLSGGNSSTSMANGASVNSNISQHFSMSPLDTQQLNENLRQLSLQRQLQDGNRAATFNLDDDHQQEPDYFNIKPGGSSYANGLDTPGGILSPPHHLSRVGSETNVQFKAENMVKVPSYTQALRSDIQEEPLSPMYQPPLPGSNINLEELNRRFEEYNSSQQSHHTPGHSRNKLLLSRGSSLNLKNLNSSHSSLRSSPTASRNVSHTNLSSSANSTGPLTKKSINNSTTLAGIPITNHKVQDVPPELLSAAQLSTSASDRSANLKRNTSLSALSSSSSNLQFLHRKK